LFDSPKTGHLSRFPEDAIFVDYLAPMRWAGEAHNAKIYAAMKSECNARQDTYLKYRWLIEYAVRVCADASPALGGAVYEFQAL
jgi:hypothetical protein